MTVIPFHEHSGVAFFICRGCDMPVHSFGHRDLDPVCCICRFLERHPELDEKSKAQLRELTTGGPSS